MAVSTLTRPASSTYEKADSASPNSSAYAAGTRPAVTGRARVRSPISESMSRSSTWLSALAPPQASARPTVIATRSPRGGTPCAPTNMPQMPVSRRSDMIRGFVNVT